MEVFFVGLKFALSGMGLVWLTLVGIRYAMDMINQS